MAFKYFELAMVIVSVLGRIAGTVAIVWLIVTRLADGFFTPLLVHFGLGFQMSYKSDKPQQEAQSQPPQLPRP